MSDSPALEVTDLQHRYGEQVVLGGVHLQVQPAEFVALLGSSGCGKTTLLRAIAGLTCPGAGSIALNGTPCVRDGVEVQRAEDRGVGLVFQDYALFPHMTVRENIAFGLPAGEPQSRIDRLLEVADLHSLGERRPAELSGGQQQRVALVRALASRPTILLLDEPFANVDASLRQRLGRQLAQLAREAGVAVLLVTHDRQTALGLADRAAVLEPSPAGATVTQLASPDTLYAHPATEAVARLSGPVSFLRGHADGAHADTLLGRIALTQPTSGPVSVVVRPHQLVFTPGPVGGDGTSTIIEQSFEGPDWRLQVTLGDGIAETQWQAGPPPGRGTQGTLTVRGPCASVEAQHAASPAESR